MASCQTQTQNYKQTSILRSRNDQLPHAAITDRKGIALGMPTVITKDASMPEIRSPQSPRGAGKEEHQHNGLPKGPEKQSLDYALRSGAAGGLAGCVVCLDFDPASVRLGELSR